MEIDRFNNEAVSMMGMDTVKCLTGILFTFFVKALSRLECYNFKESVRYLIKSKPMPVDIDQLSS